MHIRSKFVRVEFQSTGEKNQFCLTVWFGHCQKNCEEKRITIPWKIPLSIGCSLVYLLLYLSWTLVLSLSLPFLYLSWYLFAIRIFSKYGWLKWYKNRLNAFCTVIAELSQVTKFKLMKTAYSYLYIHVIIVRLAYIYAMPSLDEFYVNLSSKNTLEPEITGKTEWVFVVIDLIQSISFDIAIYSMLMIGNCS